MPKAALEKMINRLVRMAGFQRGFDQLAKVAGKLERGIVFPQVRMGSAEGNFAEMVDFPAAGRLKNKIAFEEQIDFPGKRAVRAECALGHGFDSSVAASEPMDDHAAVRKFRQSQDGSGRGFHSVLGKCGGPGFQERNNWRDGEIF